MKKFAFNLQSVLDHRLLLEEREQEKLLKILQEIVRTETGRRELGSEIEALRLRTAQPGPGEVHIEEVLQATRYIGKLEGQMAMLAQKIAHLEQRKRSQADALMEARRQREVLENLKEKYLAQHAYEAGVMEQKLLDDLAVVKFAHEDEQNLPAGKD
jgi:flagellar protein FliJ